MELEDSVGMIMTARNGLLAVAHWDIAEAVQKNGTGMEVSAHQQIQNLVANNQIG